MSVSVAARSAHGSVGTPTRGRELNGERDNRHSGLLSVKAHANVIHLVCRVAVTLLALGLVCATAVPLVRSDKWWIRLFDFPRLQIAIMLALTLAGYVALRLVSRLHWGEYLLAALVGLALARQLTTLAPYTALHPKEMSDSRVEGTSHRISLLIYNVLADNREVGALRNLIRETDPDIILLSEPTQWWLAELAGLEHDYPHTLFQPQDNQYGKLLFSRLELADPQIRFLVEPDIPSIRLGVRLRSGQAVTLYGVHPRPPGPEEEMDGPDAAGQIEDSDARDAELLTIAHEVRDLGDTPVIVAGDFNDVGWSHTMNLFQRVGGLLDPRVGRGFFNTFATTSRLVRYPLDHVFASRHFQLVELRRLADIGSDHFPLLVVLDYAPEAVVESTEPQAEAGDHRKVTPAVVLHIVLEQLLRGDVEPASGHSWFSPATAGALRTVAVDSAGHAIVDFEDLQMLMPNASSSAGSEMLLNELNAVVFGVEAVRSVDYLIHGRCEPFWEWLQRGCQTVSRPAAAATR